MRTASLIAMLTLFALPVAADPVRGVAHEPDTYRFGASYASLRGTTPDACEAQCTAEGSCAAWSLLPATFQGGPRCELKTSIGRAEPQPGTVSGIAQRYQNGTPMALPTQMSPAPAGYSTPTRAYEPTGDVALSRFRPAPTGELSGGPSETVRYSGPPTTITTVAPTPAPLPTRAPAQAVTSVPTRTVVSVPNAQVYREPQSEVAVSHFNPTPQSPAPQPTPIPVTTTTRTVTQAPTRTTTVSTTPAPQMTTRTPPPSTSAVTPTQTTTTRTVTQAAPTQTVQQTATTTPTATAPATSSLGGVSAPPPGPVPRYQNGGPRYSVQNMDVFPGDYEATAGFLDTVPQGEIESAMEFVEPEDDEDDKKSDKDDENEEYETSLDDF